MKKRLLLAALAMVGVLNASAFEVDQYVYTQTQRLKVTGENLVTNGDFAQGLTEGGWSNAAADGIVDQSVWQVKDGEGPNGESVVESQGASAGDEAALCNIWDAFEGGETYIVSFCIKGAAATTTTVGTSVGNNYADFFLNGTGSFTHVASTDDAPVVDVATAYNITDQWDTVTFVFTPDQGQMLVMRFEKMATGTQITNICVQKAMEVFDDRIALRKMAFADQILADPNFNTEEAQDAKAEFMGVYEYLRDGLASGDLDDVGEATSIVDAFDQGLNEFMDVTSSDMKDNLANIDISSIGNYGRGRFNSAGCITLEGGNWGHLADTDYLMSAIQTGYAHNATFKVSNADFPAGKYFFTAEIRNANTNKTSWPCVLTFNLETTCKMFLANDTIDATISGEDYQKFYLVADVDEDGKFVAGVYWPGVSSGGAFCIKNVQVRSFGNLEAQIIRKQAWDKFYTQWSAAVSSRNKVVAMQTDTEYPWQKDSLQLALNQWDSFYNAVVSAGWVTADGKDAGVATNDELTTWADFQGGEIPEDLKATYQVVRGYQNAINYVTARNKVFADLASEIKKAEAVRDDDMNQTGDKVTFQAAIDAATAARTNMLASTSDATMQADSLTMANAIVTLQEAVKAFVASVTTMEPIVDIDFSNGFEPIIEIVGEGDEAEETIKGYTIKGAAGQMDFTFAGVSYDEDANTYSTAGNYFALGFLNGEELLFPEVLRVGNSSATVNLPEAIGDEDVLRVQFDLWVGSLTGKSVFIDLQNENSERVAGFKMNRYNGSVSYNDFNDVLTSGGTGMDILGYVTGVGSQTASNADIAADNNRSHFDLIVDYKAKTLKGTVENPQKGTSEGALQPWPAVTDAKIVKFILGSDYATDARRCWFDNLKIYKYASQSTGVNEQVGISTVSANDNADGAIYNLMGVKMSEKPAKGLYIMNGKKYVVK